MADGVNISDVTISFSDQEWVSLSGENRRHVHEERERRRNSKGPAREINAAAAATTVTDRSSVTFDEPPPDNNNGGAGLAAGFGHGAYCDQGYGGGQGRVGG